MLIKSNNSQHAASAHLDEGMHAIACELMHVSSCMRSPPPPLTLSSDAVASRLPRRLSEFTAAACLHAASSFRVGSSPRRLSHCQWGMQGVGAWLVGWRGGGGGMGGGGGLEEMMCAKLLLHHGGWMCGTLTSSCPP
jgi:hypothetical protein